MKLWKDTGLNLPCRITVLRILGVPVFILLVHYYTQSIKFGAENEYFRVWALIVFCAVALTDALDGYIARTRKLVTRLGRILDPIADKALLLSGVITLTRPSLPELQPQIPEWFTLLIISRDVVLVAGAFVIQSVAGHVVVQPRISGKLATFFTMLTIFLVLLGMPQRLFLIAVSGATLFTIWSGLAYIYDGMLQLGKAGEE